MTGSVVVFRVFSGGEMDVQVILVQIGLLLIGLGSAMVVNLAYMPAADPQMLQIRKRIDELFSVIFKEFAATLRNPNEVWAGKELIEADKAVLGGIEAAKRSLENQVIHPNEEWSVYFTCENAAGLHSAYDASGFSNLSEDATRRNGVRAV